MKLSRFFAYTVLFISVSIPAAYAEIQANRDYIVLNSPQTPQSGNKIEVLEFFYYGCPHCYDLEPALKVWLKRLPKDVEFRSVPVIFRDSWAPLAKTFYALESIGAEQRLHDEVYDAVHLDNIDFASDENLILEWVAKHGVDRQKFADAYTSFSMQSKLAKSRQMTKDYQVQGTPSLVVDGKYLTSGSLAGPPKAMVQVLDELVRLARKERAKKR